MLPKLPRSLQFFAFSACLVAAASSFACSSDSGDDSEPADTTGSGSGGKGGSTGSGNAAGEEGDGSGGDPGSGSGSGAEGGGDSSSGGSENSTGGRGGTSSTGGTDSGGTDGGGTGGTDTGGTGGTDSGGTGGTDTGPDPEAIARGQAIAEDIDVNCSACHGLNYAGSPLYDAGNITPDEATGIGAWSDAEIGAAITEGIGKDGAPLCSIMEPYDFDEGQVRDVIAFLRSLTPVSKAPTGTCVD